MVSAKHCSVKGRFLFQYSAIPRLSSAGARQAGMPSRYDKHRGEEFLFSMI